MASKARGEHMGQTVRFQEILRRLAVIDESAVEQHAGLGLPEVGVLDARTAELVRVAAVAAAGAPAVCLEWSATRALAAGATEEEITGVLLAIAPVAGLGRVVSAVPGLAIGLGYDVETALMEADNP
jgi:alkylhydroperoxidase/carboxymuconolactone decarboxylase family protein YurZ